MAHKTKSETARRLVLFSATASILTGMTLAPVSQAQQVPKPLSSIGSPSQSALITCHGITTVPMTIDSAQTLPLQLVTNVPCGQEVAVLSDFEAYAVAVRTPDGKNGYIARMYLSASSKAPSRPAVAATSAEVKGGLAQWERGAVGCDQFTSENGVVESLTVNGVTVQVSLQDTGWKLRANIAVANEGSEVLHLNPVHFTLDTVHPAIRALAYQDPDRLAKSAATHQIYRTAANAAPVVMDASFRTQTHIVSAPNYFSPAVNPQVSFSGSPYAVADTQQYESASLREGDVATKSSVAGAVWFERDKHAEQLIFRVPVNGVLFEFPLSFKREK
jgi:hypothetical protein